MATPFTKVYDAFLARITADEWTLEEELAIVERDWQELLKIAIFRFKYPRVNLDTEPITLETPGQLVQYQFIEDLGNDEIQLLALYMKHEWIKRCISSWDNIRQLYADKDFSQANMLDKLNKLEEAVSLEIHKAEGIYDRSRHKSPANLFRKLAGKQNVIRHNI